MEIGDKINNSFLNSTSATTSRLNKEIGKFKKRISFVQDDI